MCGVCGELGDEEHVLFRCSLIRGDDLSVEENVNEIWDTPDTFELFKRINSALMFRICHSLILLFWVIVEFITSL